MTHEQGALPPAKTLAETIAPHLPLLRRFSRALNGSQSVGDHYVAATLEAIIADQSLFDATLPPRVALYQTYYRIWSSAGDGAAAPNDPTQTEAGGSLEGRMAALTPLSRQALLLTSMERFDAASAAAILGVSEDRVDALSQEALASFSDLKTARVLVIEDEAIIALDLEAMVKEMGHDVVDIVDTATNAVASARTTAPDLILADVQLADGSSGIDAVTTILGEITVPVIFITAYPERLLTGERPEPTYLITKPFQTAEVKAAIGQALSRAAV